MDTRLSPEQQLLRQSAAQMADRLGPRTPADLVDRDRAGRLEAAVAASGWRQLRDAGDDGTPWASAVEAALVAEELGRGLADVALAGPLLAAELRRLAAAPAAGGGETVALREDLSGPVRRSSAGERGAVAFDAAGAVSALSVRSAPGGYEVVTAPVPVGPGGVDLTRPARQLADPEWCALPGQERLLTDDDLARWTAFGLALCCADLVGTMRGAVRLGCEYAGARQQYGAPIGSFQAVQHLLADAFVSMEGSHSTAVHGAWAVDALPPDQALYAAAVAKAYCSRAALGVTETVVQVHGGIGNTWDCAAHLYLRRALLSVDVLGGVGISLARVAGHRGIGDADGLR